jgi:hypothetical protein
MSVSSSDLDLDSTSDYLPSENEEILYDSDEEIEIDLLKTSPFNEVKLISEVPFLLKMPLPYV